MFVIIIHIVLIALTNVCLAEYEPATNPVVFLKQERVYCRSNIIPQAKGFVMVSVLNKNRVPMRCAYLVNRVPVRQGLKPFVVHSEHEETAILAAGLDSRLTVDDKMVIVYKYAPMLSQEYRCVDSPNGLDFYCYRFDGYAYKCTDIDSRGSNIMYAIEVANKADWTVVVVQSKSVLDGDDITFSSTNIELSNNRLNVRDSSFLDIVSVGEGICIQEQIYDKMYKSYQEYIADEKQSDEINRAFKDATTRHDYLGIILAIVFTILAIATIITCIVIRAVEFKFHAQELEEDDKITKESDKEADKLNTDADDDDGENGGYATIGKQSALGRMRTTARNIKRRIKNGRKRTDPPRYDDTHYQFDELNQAPEPPPLNRMPTQKTRVPTQTGAGILINLDADEESKV